MEHDYSLPEWNPNRRIADMIHEVGDPIESRNLIGLLLRTGWKKVAIDASKIKTSVLRQLVDKPVREICSIYVPYWNKAIVLKTNFTDYKINIDYFIVENEILLYLKVIKCILTLLCSSFFLILIFVLVPNCILLLYTTEVWQRRLINIWKKRQVSSAVKATYPDCPVT